MMTKEMHNKNVAKSLSSLVKRPGFTPVRRPTKGGAKRGAKARKKFYAVRKGHMTGIFETWSECQMQVTKFPRPEFKSFLTEFEAQQYIDEGKLFDRVKDDAPPDVMHVYTDGSLNVSTEMMGGGMYAKTTDGKELRMFLGIDVDIFKEIGPAAHNCNPSSSYAELIAAVISVKRLTAAGYKKLQLHVDNDGVRNWFTGAWKAKQSSTRCALDALFSAHYDCDYLSIVHVDAHAGNFGNTEADRLANMYTHPRKVSGWGSWVKRRNGVIWDIETKKS